jgi:AbiU2
MAHKSAEEVERQHLEAMGSSLGPLYHKLHNDVVWLHAKWQQQLKLFVETECIELLNSVAAFFFMTVQRVFEDDILLHVARLVDPPTSLGRADRVNLTLLALPAVITESALAPRVHASVEEARAHCAFAVDWRNRRIAHRDLGLALRHPQAKPLPDAGRAEVEAALKSIRGVFEPIHHHHLGTDPGFERFAAGADADALLFYLRRGRQGETGALS